MRQASKLATALTTAGIIASLASVAAVQSAARASSPEPVKLVEFTPWLVNNHGPAGAKGVVYFIRGWSGGLGLDEFQLAPYMMKTLSDDGWDVIVAKYPYGKVTPRMRYASVPGAAVFVHDRAAELKAEGYKRVVLGGQSFGSWVAMAADQQKDLSADVLWLMVPNIYGPKTLDNGKPNPQFRLNYTDFVALLPALHTPAVLNTFAGDPYETGGRAKLVSAHFERDKRPDLIIDQPPGFVGHFAGWLPIYDFAYGGCMRNFMTQPADGACSPPPLDNADFRSIVAISQVADAEQKRVAAGDVLAGRSFVVYNLGLPDKQFHYLYQYKSASLRDIMSPVAQSQEAVSFHDGQQCVGSICTTLIKWSDRQYLEFDSKSGNLVAWWIEK